MPMPRPRHRRTWIATWAVLCAGGVAATAALNASSTPDRPPEEPVSAQCRAYIAEVDRQLAEAEQGGRRDRVQAYAGIRNSGEDDCDDELARHLREIR
ncbi:hypothetical protein DEJ49_01560 [Streptomyces venezuelae]|uniref:Secreted protein n=1 Tax=Streptomyces venezuelae TaxID=54571 RepID=A0A5P2CAN7_STRVZ|nr:hypothetical protein [Streptomyces venezuelae]QES39835.1 hypothetical protein DEJ49_01560 [Streptomyces venezuelae]